MRNTSSSHNFKDFGDLNGFKKQTAEVSQFQWPISKAFDSLLNMWHFTEPRDVTGFNVLAVDHLDPEVKEYKICKKNESLVVFLNSLKNGNLPETMENYGDPELKITHSLRQNPALNRVVLKIVLKGLSHKIDFECQLKLMDLGLNKGCGWFLNFSVGTSDF